MRAYNSEGRWVSEMEGFYNYHHMSDQYRPKSFKTDGFGEGNGGGYIPFGKTTAYADLMDSFQNGEDFSLKVNNGYMSWWTGGALGDANTAQEMVNHMMKLGENASNDWYGPSGKVNWFIGAAGTGIDTFANRFYIGTARPNAPVNFLGTKFYGNGRTFIKGSYVAGAIGRFSFGVAVFLDYNAYKQGEISGEKFIFNTAMGVYGLTPVGAIPAMLYFGVDAFYPGGWTGDARHPGAIKDTERRQAQFDSIINANSGMPRQYIFPYGSQKF